MSSLHPDIHDEETSANPLDLVEKLAVANDWPFHRQTDEELAAEIAGQWCHYKLWFAWHPELGVMHLSCALDMKVPAKKRTPVYALLAMGNEKLWLGHFDLWSEEGLPVFRHAVLFREGIAASSELIEDLVDIAVSECERFYPGVPVRDLGRQGPGRGDHGGAARDRRRGLMLDRRPAAAPGGRRQDGRGAAGRLARPGRAARGRAGGRACRRLGASSWPPAMACRPSPRPRSCRTALAPAALLLAVKPQMMDAALPAYARLVAPDTLVLSIAAGKPIALFERVLGAGAGSGPGHAEHAGCGRPRRDRAVRQRGRRPGPEGPGRAADGCRRRGALGRATRS